jgi:hypothetical protein
MSVLVATAKINAEHASDVEAAAERLFTAIRREQPRGIRYASCRLADGVTYLVLLEVEEGVENPLPTIPEFQEFQQGLKNWVAEPPAAGPATVLGSYRLFDQP